MISSGSIIERLLNDCYLMQRPNRKKGYDYALYRNNNVVVFAISDKQFHKLYDQLKEKDGKFTLNKNIVRQQHGNALTKVKYNQHRQRTKLNIDR